MKNEPATSTAVPGPRPNVLFDIHERAQAALKDRTAKILLTSLVDIMELAAMHMSEAAPVAPLDQVAEQRIREREPGGTDERLENT